MYNFNYQPSWRAAMNNDEYKKLSKQPLKLVLAEFRYSPVMEIGKFIPQLQESLRKTYPLPEHRVDQVINFQGLTLNVSNTDRWIFLSGNKQSAVDITQERVVYYTTEYPRFEGFAEKCNEILECFSSIVDPNLILRVGLRYSDLVTLEKDETITQIVDSHFAFPPNMMAFGENLRQRNETTIKTEIGILAIRTLYGTHQFTCFSDLESMPVNIKKEVEPSERLILDFDHFWDGSDGENAFIPKNILEKLKSMHLISRKAFWSVTTDYARNEKWA